MNEKKTKVVKCIAILAMIVLGLVALYQPAVRTWLKRVIKMFAKGDFTLVRDFIKEYGSYAAMVSFFLMVFQSLAAPLPAFLITFANASLFGWKKGALLSWSSAMVGAALCFGIARILGRDAAEKLAGKMGVQSIEEFFSRHGRQSVLIARLLPFISFDYVSYGAGLTSISFKDFLLATGIGQLPATLVYSYVGGMLTGGAKLFVTGLLILFALSITIVLIKQLYNEKTKKREETEDED